MPAYKYTLKDGKTTKWYANFYYTDWTGQKKHICKRGFKTQREAKEYERSFLDQEKTNSDILFSSLVENYLEDMSHRLKPTTMENKQFIIKGKLLPYFGNLKVCDIDTIKVRKWQNELLSYRDDSGKPFSQTYLKTINNQLSTIMNYAIKHYGMMRNPCKLAGSIGKSHAEEMKFWTQEQYEIFSQNIQKSAMKLAFDILFYTGIREGELLALTPADILPDKKLNINKNYAKVKGKELFLIPKTSKSRRKLAIPDFLYDDIHEYIAKLYGISDNDRIFYFSKSALEKEIKRVALKAGLEKIRVHDLRHSHASLLINMKVDIKVISERLGHESVKTTWDIYSHLYPDTDKKLASALNELRNLKKITKMEEYNMPKRLNGDAKTGKKIMDNQNEFTYEYKNRELVHDKMFYYFDWTFNNQSGSAVISLTADGHIDTSSTLNCDDFDRSSGLYKDKSLKQVFDMMLDSIQIEHK